MNIEALQSQQIQLLAKKSLLKDDLEQTEKTLGQIAAILQFEEARRKAEAESSPENSPVE